MSQSTEIPCLPSLIEESLNAEVQGINLYSEYSLHDTLKRLAAGPGGRIEVPMEGGIADALRSDGEIVELQTGKLGAVLTKVGAWVARGHRVRLQFPLVVSKTILRYDGESGALISRRRSPRKRTVWDLFDELIRAPGLIAAPGLVFELLLVEVDEHRRTEREPVRRGRFARKVSTLDRSLASVRDRMEFQAPGDWLDLLPPDSPEGWSSVSLGEALGISASLARKVLYCLNRAGLLEAMPRQGRLKRYRVRQA